ncbi:MAG: hypothetical protein J1F09_00575 [Oscillospiraceae bacterium]|nr:hypothetical protein [Oscillospiraceae bacterium]
MDKQEYKNISSMAANGDAKAFAHLYETVYREMYYTAFYSLENDADAVEAVQGAARDGFKAINRLRSEEAFRVFMMKTLCARIKMFFKEYGENAVTDDYRLEVKQKLFELDNADRLCAAMYIAGRFTPEEISQYSGMSKTAVKKRLISALEYLELDY